MPVTGCTWRSSPNAPGCWDRGEPPRPVRVGGARLPDSGVPGSARTFSRLVASGACGGPGGPGWTSAPAHSLHQWLGMPRRPHTQASRLGTSCACGDISVRPGASCAPGDGNAVPDGVECPRMEGHAPCRVECPRRRRWPAGCRCPEPEDAPEGSRSVPAGAVLVASGAFSTTCGLGCPRVWSGRRTAGYFRDGNQGQLSAQTECQRTGEVHPGEQDRPRLRG